MAIIPIVVLAARAAAPHLAKVATLAAGAFSIGFVYPIADRLGQKVAARIHVPPPAGPAQLAAQAAPGQAGPVPNGSYAPNV